MQLVRYPTLGLIMFLQSQAGISGATAMVVFGCYDFPVLRPVGLRTGEIGKPNP